ncbi:copper homeostasis protein cutC homolog isoform X2 [Venturia canescens]|nr:copper homeostasis protein cutC homolog isoform X2 [Venturia canescens]XP_043272871.1 copper homeostasis protein cutC homolog isoform X2 [Venturia canescens]XP_043272872.1 copper homeostasis protein cutC homolog isoform X2 [Venturia canescens]
MEICVDSIESAKNAISGGANRLEVCSALSEGGLTPTPGLIKSIRNHDGNIKLYAMIRLRSGDFVYSRDEMDGMLYDLEVLKGHEVDGFVFGALRQDGSIDSDYCREIISAAKPKPVTFHRAFDEAVYPLKSIESIIDLGFERVLTSGQRNTAIEGVQLIKKLIDRADDRIVIMPGSGINPTNIEAIKSQTGAREFHASAKKRVELPPAVNKVTIGRTDDHSGNFTMITSKELVQQMVEILEKL